MTACREKTLDTHQLSIISDETSDRFKFLNGCKGEGLLKFFFNGAEPFF